MLLTCASFQGKLEHRLTLNSQSASVEGSLLWMANGHHLRQGLLLADILNAMCLLLLGRNIKLRSTDHV